MSDALITNADGISGMWQPPANPPDPLVPYATDNLQLWAPEVRASLFDFEVFSKIGFSSDGETCSVWHLETAPGSPPTATYEPLVSMTRPSMTDFANQLIYINQYSDLRRDRAVEINAQIDAPTSFFGSIGFMDSARTPKTGELFFLALRFARYTEMQFKNALACKRPVEFSPQIQPMIPTPQHGALPSGHSTEAFICATILGRLLSESGNTVYGGELWQQELYRQASRIAINRTVAGVHFPVDSAAGACLGITLGNYLCDRASEAATYEAWNFVGTAFTNDFDWQAMYDTGTGAQIASGYQVANGTPALGSAGASKFLKKLWDDAVSEWKQQPPSHP